MSRVSGDHPRYDLSGTPNGQKGPFTRPVILAYISSRQRTETVHNRGSTETPANIAESFEFGGHALRINPSKSTSICSPSATRFRRRFHRNGQIELDWVSQESRVSVWRHAATAHQF